MPVVESSIGIAASAVDVFDLAQDYGLRLAWDPFLRARLRALMHGMALSIVCALPIYASAKSAWADVQTDRFCSIVHPGDRVEGLEARARNLGLRAFMGRASAAGELPPALLVWEGWAFARHFCNVEHDGTRVTKCERYFLD